MVRRMTTTNSKPRGYAAGTDVTVERSRAELDQLLTKHGATEIGILRRPAGTLVVFVLEGLRIRQTVAQPDPESLRRPAAPKSRNQHTRGIPSGALLEQQLTQAVEAELRRRWRALILITKAKLELIEHGDSTIAREFMADTVLPSDETVGEVMLPRIAKALADHTMPPLQLGSGR